MNAVEITRQVEEAFADVPRPARFTDRDHCCECAEHDDTLAAFDRDTIGLEQLGNPGWDPICFAEPEAFLYYFPAMVRLAVDCDDDYLDQFLFHLTYQGEDNRFFGHFSKSQRQATLAVLRHLRADKAERLKEWCLEEDLDAAIALWTKLAGEM